MPDTRSHRGPDPDDAQLFAPAVLDRLRQATADLSWLLTRGYALRSAVELVGNRYTLTARQRMAVGRSACSEPAAVERNRRRMDPQAVRGKDLWIDGLNVLTGIEVALSGGVVLLGRDGCFRDIAGVHRQYRRVEETMPALQLIGELTSGWGVAKCRWWLDKPVSNTGRLKAAIVGLAAERGWNWEAELVFSPDAILSRTDQTIVSSDSIILDRCQHWINLVRLLISERIPQAWVVDLSLPGPG
jgi:hypothetical protein